VDEVDPGHELPDIACAWAAKVVGAGARVVRTRRLPGATSSCVDALDVASPRGQVARLVLRRYLDPTVLASEPRAVEREAAVLQAIERLEIAVPRLMAIDHDGTACGAPALLMTRVPGRPRVRPRSSIDEFVDQLAAPLPAIHATRVPPDPSFPMYLPYSAAHDARPPDWARHRDAWELAIRVHGQATPDGPRSLIHRDYHPGNVLWRGSTLSGIVDWAWACRGPAEVDVAHCRLNLALQVGARAADDFLASWQLRAGADDYDPSWDLRDAVDFLPASRVGPTSLARLDDFVARGAAALA
jgi:aminoglycoside phosphotransferase (APT) family kinase protein